MSHIWMSYATHLNKSCLTSEWVVSHSWTSHHTHLNESSEWAMSYTWMSHVTHLNKSQHTSGWVTTHITDESPTACTGLPRTMYTHESPWCPFTTHTCISHATCLNESRHTSEWVTSCIWKSHVALLNAPDQEYDYESWLSHVTKSETKLLTTSYWETVWHKAMN